MSSLAYLVRQSPRLLIFAVAAGLLSGASNVGLLAVINNTLNRQGPPSRALIWSFVAIGVFFVATRFVSNMVLQDLSKRTMVALQLQLSHRILATPLRRLEELGSHRLIAAMAQDVTSISSLAMQLPGFCLDLSVVLGCLIYLGYLSVPVLLTVIGFAVMGIVSLQLADRQTSRLLTSIRQNETVFFKHLRTLIEGNKELKLNRQRRIEHFGHALQATGDAITRQASRVAMVFAGMSSWAFVVFYSLIGLLLFVVAAPRGGDIAVITGSLLVILVLRGPLEGVTNIFQNINRASVALRSIESLGLSEPERLPDVPAGRADTLPPWTHVDRKSVV